MSEHTKGPWTATKHDQHWVRVNVTIKAGGNTWVAFMPDEDKDERMANARLMAAAPELLEALQGIMNIVSESLGVAGYYPDGDYADWDEFPELQAAEAAIAKAKGEV